MPVTGSAVDASDLCCCCQDSLARQQACVDAETLVFLPSISRLLCLELNTYTIGKARRCNQGSGQALAGKFCKATLGKAPQYIAGPSA